MSLEDFKEAIKKKNYKTIKTYCKTNPALINTQDASGNTPLHEAVLISQKHSKSRDYTQTLDYQKIAHYLIKHGGKLEISNNSGQVVLDKRRKV